MPSIKQILPISLATAAFAALAITAATLGPMETTEAGSAHVFAATRTGDGVTVAWVTDYDPMLGGERVVGATLATHDGAILADSTIELTIVAADGVDLGTMTSLDGGRTWTESVEPVAARDAVVASVRIDDRETVASVDVQ